MNKGITIHLNGIGFHFNDYEELFLLLDCNCDETTRSSSGDRIEWDDEKEE